MNSAHCSKCVCVCVCVFTTVCVCVHYSKCALGWVKCREHISLLVILCIIVYVTNEKKKRYPIMVKCLNIGTNIGKPIYRSISTLLLGLIAIIVLVCRLLWEKSVC